MPDVELAFSPIVETLRRAAAALRDAEIPFALGGSLACWARGGPEVTNDLDLVVRPQDADAALEALAAAGMRRQRPPEEWLYKAWDGNVMLDLIFELVTGPVTDRTLARAQELTVASVTMPVMALEDVLVAKLLSLDEHGLDLSPLLGIARALREQVDWADVRSRSAHSPYARAFFTLLEGLDIVGPDERAGADEVVVRPDVEATRRGVTAFGPSSRDPR
jgi:putative nucleotidyltransferase-like protein